MAKKKMALRNWKKNIDPGGEDNWGVIVKSYYHELLYTKFWLILNSNIEEVMNILFYGINKWQRKINKPCCCKKSSKTII